MRGSSHRWPHLSNEAPNVAQLQRWLAPLLAMVAGTVDVIESQHDAWRRQTIVSSEVSPYHDAVES